MLRASGVAIAVAPADLETYYRTIAPFYRDEMTLRVDIPDWQDLVRRLGARSVLDLGCGDGRLARALAGTAHVVGVDLLTALLPSRPRFAFVQGDLRRLPFADGRFDLAIAANDPFAHLLEDPDRSEAVGEAARVARQVVIDGLALTGLDDARTRTTACVREATLPVGVVRQEVWRAAAERHRYVARYRYLRRGALVVEAATVVRAWARDEPALRGWWPRLYGTLDGRPYDPDRRGFVISIGGAL